MTYSEEVEQLVEEARKRGFSPHLVMAATALIGVQHGLREGAFGGVNRFLTMSPIDLIDYLDAQRRS